MLSLLVLGPVGGAVYCQFFVGFSHSEQYCASISLSY